MPALQTTYGPYLAPAFAGQVADMRPSTVVSREVEGNAPLPFGGVALRGVTDHGCGPVGLTNAKGFLGIAVGDATVRPTNVVQDSYAPAFAAGSNTVASATGADTAAIMTRGAIWVSVGVAVTQGDPAFYTSAGAITNASTGNTALNGVFDTSTAGAGLAVLVLR